MTLKDFLAITHSDNVHVCVKEPGKCAQYWTTLKNGKSNIHTDGDLNREVYSVHITYDGGEAILGVYAW